MMVDVVAFARFETTDVTDEDDGNAQVLHLHHLCHLWFLPNQSNEVTT
jgi:hypothetical protein